MENPVEERRKFLKALGVGGATMLLGGVRPILSFAKGPYPSDRLIWILPVKAGGGFDMAARLITPYLTKHLKESSKEANKVAVFTKNIYEAGGIKAYESVFNAKPDGYTIGYFNAAVVTENITSKIDIDYNQYTYLVRTHFAVRTIVTHKRSKFKNWEGMMKAGKEKELKWGASNFGRGHHVACILVKETAKVPARLINFPGSAENSNALLRGDVDLGIIGEASGKAMIDAGEFIVLTTLSETTEYPGVPSIAQLGYPELADPLKLHYYLIAPPKLPQEVTDILISSFKKVFSDKEFLANAKKLEIDPDPLYGVDAQRVAQKFFKYYEEKTPILKKYLE